MNATASSGLTTLRIPRTSVKPDFQVIEDLKGGLSLYNHEGNLHPFTEKKIIERQCKVKKSVIVERFGNL
ncbi:MAG: hypothetical protein MZV70_12365 [Desulfobacterales bacterium]|nr:hypothetical protein [Desulfobacterales bacterium]